MSKLQCLNAEQYKLSCKNVGNILLLWCICEVSPGIGNYPKNKESKTIFTNDLTVYLQLYKTVFLGLNQRILGGLSHIRNYKNLERNN